MSFSSTLSITIMGFFSSEHEQQAQFAYNADAQEHKSKFSHELIGGKDHFFWHVTYWLIQVLLHSRPWRHTRAVSSSRLSRHLTYKCRRGIPRQATKPHFRKGTHRRLCWCWSRQALRDQGSWLARSRKGMLITTHLVYANSSGQASCQRPSRPGIWPAIRSIDMSSLTYTYNHQRMASMYSIAIAW